MTKIHNFQNPANVQDVIGSPIDPVEQIHRQNIRILYRMGYTRPHILEIIGYRGLDYRTRKKENIWH